MTEIMSDAMVLKYLDAPLGSRIYAPIISDLVHTMVDTLC